MVVVRAFRLDRLSDLDLSRALRQVVVAERTATVAVLAHVAEFDRRRLYLGAGYPCMRDYCIGELHLSEGAAYRRIAAARAARCFPVLFEALADGRLHLSAVTVLQPHLTSANVDELVLAATHRSKAQVQVLIAERFPNSESLPLVCEVSPSAHVPLFPGRVNDKESQAPLVPGRVSAAPSRVSPVAAQRFALSLTMSGEMRERLRYYGELVSHAHPAADLAGILDDALRIAIRHRERRKFAATEQPRPARAHASRNPRHIPAHVRRAVTERDRGQCTFVSDSGHRCGSRKDLEYDHVEPVARGGAATVAGMRLRCRAHNQYAAEQAFGAGFMERKREAARVAAAGNAEARAAEASGPAACIRMRASA